MTSRRAFLCAMAGLAASAGCGGQPAPLPAPTVTDSKPDRPVNVEYVRSAARGTEVKLVVIRPAGATEAELPVCLSLHGRGSNASMSVQLNVPDLLTKAVNDGTPPFAVVGLDGGDAYWVARDRRDDPQRMLTDELPGWLGERGLATTPFAAFGISMGAYGALNYARNPHHPAVAAISPALFLSWADAEARDAFAGEREWADTEPLRHVDALGDVPLGVWCGTDDPFIDAARQLVDLAKPQVARLDAGSHDADYWLRVMPDIMRFIGTYV